LGATFPMHGSYLLRRQATRALAPIALHQGDRDIAWGHVLAILPEGHATRPGSTVFLDALMLQGIAMDLCLESGDGDEARRWLDAQARWLSWSGSLLGQADHTVFQARIAHVAGDMDGAERLAMQAIDMTLQPAQPMVTLRARRLLGEILLDGHELDRARREWSGAIILAEAVGSPFERALAMEGLARSTVNDDREAAIASVREARSLLVPLGAVPALRRLEAFLQRTDSRSGDSPLPNGLTAREVDVLRLVAQGMTDADVGDRLSISPRTVGQHLRSTYGKIGVKSRAGATRFAIEHDLD
jgi:DNA-binding CsgD family transcriptional regulator